MKKISLLLLFNAVIISVAFAQSKTMNKKQKEGIYKVIDEYAQAREKKDTILLKRVLTEDADQLVSSGEWRNGMKEAVKGMLRSSESNSGSRKIIVDKIKLLNDETAIVDARYEIKNPDGTDRKMWSTFIVVLKKDEWKISAIRNMLPAGIK